MNDAEGRVEDLPAKTEADSVPFRSGCGRQQQSTRVHLARPGPLALQVGGDGLAGLRDDDDDDDEDVDDVDTLSTYSSSACSSHCGEVPDGVKAVLGAAVDTAAASLAPAINIDRMSVEKSRFQVGNNMHVHGPLTVVVSPSPAHAAALSERGLVLSAAKLGLADAEAGTQAAVRQEPAAGEATQAQEKQDIPAAAQLEKKAASLLLGPWWRSQCPFAVLVAVVAGVAVVVAVRASLPSLAPGGAQGPRAQACPRHQALGAPAAPVQRAHGVRYVQRDMWGACPARGRGQTLRTPVDTVIVHHTGTAGCSSPASCSELVYAIQQTAMVDNGWDDVGYNFLVGGDGRVYEGRGWDRVGAFLYGWNSKSLGVALVGTFTADPPGGEQQKQLAGLLRLGVELGKIQAQYRLAGACQLQSTKSPGLRFMQDLRTWERWWNHSSVAYACTE